MSDYWEYTEKREGEGIIMNYELRITNYELRIKISSFVIRN